MSFRAKPRNLLLFLTVALLVALKPGVAGQETDISTAESPNKNWVAVVRRLPDREAIWRKDLDGFRLVIVPVDKDGTRGETYLSHDFERRLVGQIAWTADSRFVVFTTASSGGHQPWHFTAYVFSITQRKIKCLDDSVGPVVRERFDIQPPHSALMQIANPKSSEVYFDQPVTKTVDLETLFRLTNRN